MIEDLSLTSKRQPLSQKSQSSLNKLKYTTEKNKLNKNLKYAAIKKKAPKKLSATIKPFQNTKVKFEDKDNKPINSNNLNNNTVSKHNSGKYETQSINNEDNANQQIQLNYPPGITVDQDGKAPVSYKLVKENYRSMLTTYEMTEIDNYSDIFFIGNSISKKNAKGIFDQDKTFQYKAKAGDHIAYRYEILSLLDMGKYGILLKCTDHKTKEKVAIKIYANTPENNQRGQVEIKNMKELTPNAASAIKNQREPLQATTNSVELISSEATSTNPNTKHVVKMIDNFVFRNHICIVMELLGESLIDYMKKTPQRLERQEEHKLEPLPPHMVKLIAYQIMDGLVAIHRKKIIHNGLNPLNVLFTNHHQEDPMKYKVKGSKIDAKKPEKIDDKTKEIKNQQTITHHFTFSFTEIDNYTLMSQVKIFDFGSSCKQAELVRSQTQKLSYMAPEIVLGSSYGPSVDVWSAGCIIVELFTGKPLFPATDETDLLVKFIETLGMPPKSVVEMMSDFQSKTTKKSAPKRNRFFGDDGRLLNVARQPVPFKNRLTSILKSSDTMMIDFLTKCFEWDKTKRLSAAKLIKHPWIARLAKQNI